MQRHLDKQRPSNRRKLPQCTLNNSARVLLAAELSDNKASHCGRRPRWWKSGYTTQRQTALSLPKFGAIVSTFRKLFETTSTRSFQGDIISSVTSAGRVQDPNWASLARSMSRAHLATQLLVSGCEIWLDSCCNDKLIVQQSASVWMPRLKDNLVGDTTIHVTPLHCARP